jgi:outer membrane protein assembly factor BamB
MTDQELIQLLHDKPVGELSPEELELLRARWTQSPELRQALVEHLHLETQLATALGQVNLDINSLLKRAAVERRRSLFNWRLAWRWAVGICLLLAIAVSSQVWLGGRAKPNADVAQRYETSVRELNGAEQPAVGDEAGSHETAAAATNEPAANTDPRSSSDGDSGAKPPATADGAKPPLVEPWTVALSRDIAPWPANSPKLTLDMKASGHYELSEAQARLWFSQVDGQPFNWGQDVYGPQQMRAARFQGLARLRAPWTEESLLRLTPFDVSDLTLYLWRGPTGLALRLYTRREPHQWAAFQISRENSAPKPMRWGLLTTDNGSYARAGTGTFDLRYQDGGITLARGGIPLMTAPLAGRPDEVFVEGQFRLRGISIHKSAPLPSLPENPHPIVAGGSAAELSWAASAETPAEIVSNPDGSSTFKSDSRDKLGTVVLPLTERGLYEVIARVDSADPGTGLFLGDIDGRPIHRVGFFKDTHTGQTTLGVLRPGEVRDTSGFGDPNAFPPPYHTSVQWIKVVAGVGTVQILVSGDGRHWGHLVENPSRDLPGAVGSIGLFGLPGPAARSLKLSRLEVRELAGLTSVADHQLVSLTPRFGADDWKSAAQWSHRVVDSRPADVELVPWFTACAVATLKQGPPREFGAALLKRLVSVAVRSGLEVRRKLQVLDEAALLCDCWDEASAHSLAVHFNEIGDQLIRGGDVRPLATVRPAIVRSPMWTASKLRFAWEQLNSREVLLVGYGGDWSKAWETGLTTTFWNSGPHPNMTLAEPTDTLGRQARWLMAVAVEHAPHLDNGQTAVLPVGWRHPLTLQWNKEAYNVRSELQSALTGETYEDACRIVMSIGSQAGPGLLPDMDDRQLFVSLPTAVAGAMKLHHEFARLMADKFGPLGVIRVRKAIQSSDVAAVQAATLQFFGTEAAVEAHQWLGDLDLSAGRFPSAEEHFLLALAHALPRQRDELESRLQLALALNGKPLLSAASVSNRPIEVNGTTIGPAELESLVKDLSARPSPASRFSAAATSHVDVPTLPVGDYRVDVRANFDGQPGLNPGRYEYRFGDPFGRQLAVAGDERRLYVSNRFQVNAYAMPGGQQQWAQGLGSEQGESHAMPFTPMRPLVAGDRLFVRRLTKGGVELACLNVDNGQVLWHQRPNLQVLSDPVFWNGSLFALTLAKIDEDLVQVEATRFDFETGAATSSQPLFRLRDSNDRAPAAQLTISGRLAVFTMSGISACFDGSGEIHWLRRHLWLPKTVDDLSEDFRVADPAIRGDRVIVSVPGVRTINCMDLETGRSIWQRTLPELRGLLSVTGNRVLADTTDGLMALSSDDGSIVWTKSLGVGLEAFQTDEKTLLVAHRVTLAPNRTRPYLLWLDLASGRELAQSEVDGLERTEAQLGPVCFAGGKCWSLAGQGWKETKRELVEMTARSSLHPGPLTDASLKMWSPEVPDSIRAAVALVLPGWSLESNDGPRWQLIPGDVRGESFVLSGKIEPAADLRLLRAVDIPTGKKTTLRLRYGNQPGRNWSLAVRLDRQTLLEQTVDDAGGTNGWREAVIDLTPYNGHRVVLQMIQSVTAPHPATESLWKHATIVIE